MTRRWCAKCAWRTRSAPTHATAMPNWPENCSTRATIALSRRNRSDWDGEADARRPRPWLAPGMWHPRIPLSSRMSRAARAASVVRDPPGVALTWVRRCLAVWEGREPRDRFTLLTQHTLTSGVSLSMMLVPSILARHDHRYCNHSLLYHYYKQPVMLIIWPFGENVGHLSTL
jgi:hypothetical protein